MPAVALAPAHINQVTCALRFFYAVTLGRQEAIERIISAREPVKQPLVLSAEEVARFLEAVPALRDRVALVTAYAAGLRVGEVSRLKPGSIDSKRMLILITGGKGDCGHQRIAYNSCRNSNCPKCQAAAAHEWLEARRADLLPVEYFHVVFTLPAPVAAIAYHNKAVAYAMLFEAAAETLKTIAADKRHLGAEIGATMVLHTWGQTLTHHPHVHCIVPGGGLSPACPGEPAGGDRWIACRQGFFLPVRVLSRLYRRLFLEKLTAAHRAGKLEFFGDLKPLADRSAFDAALAPLRSIEWLVYAKRPFAGPEQVLAYLARYTHRVAISNHRLLAIDDDRITFSWLDYRHGARTKPLTLEAHEFIRRFLLHILPDGLQRIRHYGFLANGHRRAKLAAIRRLLAAAPPPADKAAEDQPERSAADASELPPCPCCGGRMLIIEVLPGPRRRCRRLDTS